MAPSSHPQNGPVLLAKILGVLAFEVLAVVLLHWAGHYQFLQVPWGDLDRWLRDAPAEDVLAATIRVLGLVLAYWVLASTVLYTVSLFAGRPRLVVSASWVMLPGARRVLDGLLAVSLTGGTLTAALPVGSAGAVTAATKPDGRISGAPTPNASRPPATPSTHALRSAGPWSCPTHSQPPNRHQLTPTCPTPTCNCSTT